MLGMRIDPADLVPAILHAPVWARLGIAVPQERMRESAAAAIARAIVANLDEPSTDADQLALPF